MTVGKATGTLNINGQMSGTSLLFMVYRDGAYKPASFTGLGSALKNSGFVNNSLFSFVSPDTVS